MASSEVPFRRSTTQPIGLPINRQNVVFAKSHKRVICCQGSTILVLDSSKGSIIRRLTGHTNDVTQVCLRKSNQLQLLSCSLDGTVRLWDYEDGKCLVTWNLGAKVFSISVSASLPDHALVSCKQKPRKNFSKKQKLEMKQQSKIDVMLINVNDAGTAKPGDRMAKRLVRTLAVDRAMAKVRPILHGSCAIMAAGKELFLWDVRAPTIKQVKLTAPATALAAHPSESYVVVGDRLGKINFWHCLERCEHEEEVVPCTGDLETQDHATAACTAVEHWHSNAVGCLAISHDGGDLFSGGEEGVLVQWQLQTHKKDFLPRLLAPIQSISLSEDGMLCALCCPDNSVRMLSLTTMKETWRIRGLALANRARRKKSARTEIVFDPTSNALVLNDLLGSGKLQFYDVTRDQHLISLRLLPRNLISRMNRGVHVPSLVVTSMAFSRDGSALATIDSLSGTQSLKFWTCVYRTNAKVAQHFKLDCIVDRPHGDLISGLLYHPKRHLVATMSADGTCKLWGRRDATDESETTPAIGSKQVHRRVWTCRAICSYREYGCTSGAFSHDGSILALAFGATITLWDPFTNTLLHTLLHQRTHNVTTLEFMADSAYLVSSSGGGLVVWDLLTLQVWWSHSMPILAMAIQPKSTRIVVALDNDVEEEPTVVAVKKKEPKKRKREEDPAPAPSASKKKKKKSAKKKKGKGKQPKKRKREEGGKDSAPVPAPAPSKTRGKSTMTFLLIFDVGSRAPLAYTRVPFEKVCDVAFMHRPGHKDDLLVVASGDGMVHLLSWDDKGDGPKEDAAPGPLGGDKAAFHDVFSVPKAIAGSKKREISSVASFQNGASFEKMLEAPSHILPPPSLMFRVFLKDLHKNSPPAPTTTATSSASPSPSADSSSSSSPCTVTKPAPGPRGIPTSVGDLVKAVKADKRLGTFAELARLFQAKPKAKTGGKRKAKAGAKAKAGGKPKPEAKAKAKAKAATKTPSKAASKAPSKKAVGKTPSKKAVGKTPSKKAVGKTPSKKAVGKTPSKKAVGKTPSKAASKTPSKAASNPSKKAVGKTPSKKAVAKTPSKKAVGKTPSKKAVGKTPSKAASKPSKKAQKDKSPVSSPSSSHPPKPAPKQTPRRSTRKAKKTKVTTAKKSTAKNKKKSTETASSAPAPTPQPTPKQTPKPAPQQTPRRSTRKAKKSNAATTKKSTAKKTTRTTRSQAKSSAYSLRKR